MALKLSVCLIYVLQTHCTSFFSLVLYSCCCSMAKLCAMLCGPMKCSTWGFLVLDYLSEFAQIHVHWVSDAIQPPYPVNPFSTYPRYLPASESFPMSRLFSSGVLSIGASASVLPMNIQCWFPLRLTSLISLQSKGLSTVFSSTTVWKHQFFGVQTSLWSNSHIHTWLLVLYSRFLFSSVQSLSHVWLFVIPWTAARQAFLSITNSCSLLTLTSIELVMPSHPLSSLVIPPSIFPNTTVFSNELVLCIRWPKYCSFSFSISPYNEYSGLISFRMDWFDFLAVQEILKILLQHHSSKASILQHPSFFIDQLLHPYMTTGKTIALTIRIFVSKVMSLLFNVLSRFVRFWLVMYFITVVYIYQSQSPNSSPPSWCPCVHLFIL